MREDEVVADQLSSDRRSVALLALGKVLTFQSISLWHRVVSRVLSVSISELHFYCACSLIRTALTDLSDSDSSIDLSADSVTFDLLISEIVGTGVKKMSYRHLSAFIDCVVYKVFEPEQHDGVAYIPLQAWSSPNPSVDPSPNPRNMSVRDRKSILENLLRVLLVVNINEEFSQDGGSKAGLSVTRARQKSFAVSKEEFLLLLSLVQEHV